MGQEFVIKSKNLEDKINQLLPSQGGFQAGVDLSASTQIIPIVDLTESAEGSNLRQDLQTALSHDTTTTFSVNNATDTTLVNTTGYYRVFGSATVGNGTTADKFIIFNLFDGSTAKNIYNQRMDANSSYACTSINFDFVVFLEAGDSLRCTASDTAFAIGCTKQIADISGNLS